MKVTDKQAGIANALLITSGALLPDEDKGMCIDICAARMYDVEISDDLVKSWEQRTTMLSTIFAPAPEAP